MSDEVKIGSVVRLKSGGPKMTVHAFEADFDFSPEQKMNGCICQWFERDTLREGTFHPDTIELVDQAEETVV